MTFAEFLMGCASDCIDCDPGPDLPTVHPYTDLPHVIVQRDPYDGWPIQTGAIDDSHLDMRSHPLAGCRGTEHEHDTYWSGIPYGRLISGGVDRLPLCVA